MRRRAGVFVTTITLVAALTNAAFTGPASAVQAPEASEPPVAPFERVSGSGSTWAANMIDQWIADTRPAGLSVDYSAVGSTAGREQFGGGFTDFAVSELPYGAPDARTSPAEPLPARGLAYLPIVQGGTALTYNLTVAGQRVSSLRLSGETLARIFTGGITRWNDPAIQADNPYLALPDIPVVPVVRGDGAGTTYQFTAWLSSRYPSLWGDHCTAAGLAFTGTCPPTSVFPDPDGRAVAQAGSLGVVGYIRSATGDGTIGYVETSYALQAQLPTVKLLNAAGYFVEPTPGNVQVAMSGATVRADGTLDLEPVYINRDPRAYPISGASYAIVPTSPSPSFTPGKGAALAAFLGYALCAGQGSAAALGYSPLASGLVTTGLATVATIPGAGPVSATPATCGGPGPIAAPQPPACDLPGAVQCTTGTGGLQQETPISRGTPAVPASLLVSGSADRSAPRPLDGAALRGRVYVFVGPSPGSDVTSVTFRLDGRRIRTDRKPPFDLVGGTSGVAFPLDLSRLSRGSHRVTATVRTASGQEDLMATFRVTGHRTWWKGWSDLR